jgi:hypothetical protein
MRSKKSRKSAFVPRVLVRTAIAGVIPACALACGDSNESSPPVADAGHDAGFFGGAGVALQAYDSAAPDVAAPSFESGAPDANDASADSAPKVIFGVAAVAYRAFDSAASDGEPGGEPADARPDVFRGPVPLAVMAYEVEPPTKGS